VIGPPQTPEEVLRLAWELVNADPGEALGVLREAGQVLASDPASRGPVLLVQAEAATRLGQIDEALTHLTAAEQHGANHGHHPQAWTYFMTKGRLHAVRGETGLALSAFKSAAGAAGHSGDARLEADALNRLAQEQHRAMESIQALVTLDRVLALRRSLDDAPGEIKTLSNKALILIALGELSAALDLLTHALKNLEGGAAAPLELHLRSNLGMLNEQMGRLEEAAQHYARARVLVEGSGVQRAGAVLALNAGEVERKLEHLSAAQTLLEEALDSARQVKDTQVEGQALHSLGLLYSQVRRFGSAHEHLVAAHEIAQANGDMDSQIQALLGLGRNWLAQQDGAQAVPALERALSLAERGERAEAAFDAHGLLADAYEHGSPRQALTHLRHAQRLERQLRDAAIARQVQDLTAAAELQQARRAAEYERRLRAASEATVQAQLAELERGRLYDDLTGLPNRLLLHALLSQALERASREGQAVVLGVLDLDRFKHVNDTFGHAAGDDLLRQVAARVSSTLRGSDCLARVSADEFVLTLHQVEAEALENLGALSRRILSVMEPPFLVAGQEITVAASLGLARFPEHGATADDLRRAANLALRDAKTLGSGTEVYRGGGPERQAALKLETAIARALERSEFELHYQPLVCARTGDPVAAEALLRWNSPQVGSPSPAEFIPMLERSGLIVPVGDWVLREACRAASRWGGVRVAVNLSARQFAQGSDLLRSVDQALEESGLPGDLLELEITESLMMQSSERASRLIHDLKTRGVRMVLDDFGTGYSSLSYLQRFPLDGLKIDRSFVAALQDAETRQGRGIVRAIVKMSKELGLDVVAEGVETHVQQGVLTRLGVQVLQGYLFGKPRAGWHPASDSGS